MISGTHSRANQPRIIRQTFQRGIQVVDSGLRLHVLHVHHLERGECCARHRFLVGSGKKVVSEKLLAVVASYARSVTIAVVNGGWMNPVRMNNGHFYTRGHGVAAALPRRMPELYAETEDLQCKSLKTTAVPFLTE